MVISRHPDTFFKDDTVNTSYMVGEDGKALFEAKGFKMAEARRIERAVLILVGAKIIGTLIKNNFFVDLCQ